MASNTLRLNLYKVDPKTDGNQTFNIEKMMNENWDRIDGMVAMINENGHVINKDGSVIGGVTIVEGDWNTVVKPGTYYGDGEVANTPKPDGVDHYTSTLVDVYEIDGGILQVAQTLDGYRFFRVGSPLTWSGWGIFRTTKSAVGLSNVENYGVATQQEAEQLSDFLATDKKYMSPKKTAQAIRVHNNDEKAHGLRSDKVAVGSNSEAVGSNSIAIGTDAKANSNQALAIGYGAISQNVAALAIGIGAEAIGGASTALGRGSESVGSSSVAVGRDSSSDGDYSVAFGYRSTSPNKSEGVLGSTEISGTRDWKVPGSFTVSGTKNFEMPHPDPDKKYTYMLRHSAVESPTAGDNLYRFTIEAEEANQTVEMELPDYFPYLNKNVDVWVNGYLHFGRAFGVVEGDKLKVTCETAGEYKVLVIGTRNDDHPSIQEWDIKGVEREIGESWTGETYVFEIDEIMELEEIKEVV